MIFRSSPKPYWRCYTKRATQVDILDLFCQKVDWQQAECKRDPSQQFQAGACMDIDNISESTSGFLRGVKRAYIIQFESVFIFHISSCKEARNSTENHGAHFISVYIVISQSLSVHKNR